MKGILFSTALTSVLTLQLTHGQTAPNSVDLSNYLRVGRYDLPEPTRMVAPPGNLLGQEASGVAYNWETDTLFIVGDGGRSVTQVSKTGQLIDTMTLGAGNSPQGTAFFDIEGIAYIGGGQFVLAEERDRRLVLVTYVAGKTLTRADATTVKLGTYVENIGTEGVSYDPLTGGYIAVKEIQPQGIFQTNVDFDLGTATNGSPTTANSVNLCDPALMGLEDIADVFALSNLPSLVGQPQFGNLLVLSQESARIVNVDRNGNVLSYLQIVSDPGNPLTAANQQHEGLTMDREGNIYVVNENGGGDIDHPQLWVYSPSKVPNQAPTGIALSNALSTVLENTVTASPLKVADIVVTDDGLGNNQFTLTGPDAAFFEVSGSGLFIKAGTVLDYETKISYQVTLHVRDTALSGTPDVSVDYTLTLIDVVDESSTSGGLIISEVAPWSSGNSPVSADWFEVTNTGNVAVDLTGWKVDDNSNSYSAAVDLKGITSIAPGESVIFLETSATNQEAVIESFKTVWFSGASPANLQIGTYNGSGIGLSTGGDAVNLFDASGNLKANVVFGASPSAAPFATFNNAVGLDRTTISLKSIIGVHGAFAAPGDMNEIGSPGTTGKLFISEVASWGSGATPYASDWFELTNPGARPVDLTNWKMDDNSNSYAAAVALSGVTSIAPGESVIFMETATPNDLPAKKALFLNAWFGGTVPAGLQVGSYSGGGVGLSTGGDAVNVFDASGNRVTGVAFGTATSGPFASFENQGRLGSDTLPLSIISALSSAGKNGAFAGATDATEVGSPGTTGRLVVTEIAPWSSGNSPFAADWFEVTNTGTTAVDLTGWKMDDSSESPVAAVALNGIASIAPGESVIFLETATPTTTIPLFLSTWFGTTPPADLQVGSYTGGGVGLSDGGDAVNLYDPNGVRRSNVSFGDSPTTAPFATFDNAGGSDRGAVARLSVPGSNGAFLAKNDLNAAGSPGTAVIRGPVNLSGWLAAYGVTDSEADADGDNLSYLLEFAFGLNPRRSDNAFANVDVAGGVLNTRGVPTIHSQPTADGVDFRVTLLRRTGTAAAGLTYTPEFSSDMETWEKSTVVPTVVATDGEMEAVTIPYPFFVNGKKAQFFRVTVTGN